MRQITRSLALATLLLAPLALHAQQPEIVHAQLTTQTVAHLTAELDTLKHETAPLWVGYSIPAMDKFSSGWNSNETDYLEGGHSNGTSNDDRRPSFDHAVILLRLEAGSVDKVQVEAPDRKLDAGNLRFVWLTNVTPDDSVATLTTLVKQDDSKRLRDSAIFAISIYQAPASTQALIALTAPANDLAIREKSAFWLANQHGHDGFVAIQRLAREDADPAFREKLTFDLTLTKDPAAITELIRMAHEDSAPRVRKQAQFWMAQKGGKLVAVDLHNLAENDPEASLRKSAVFAISQLPRDEATTQLIQLARTGKDPEVRKQAVFWLGQSNDPRALDYLTQLITQ